MKFPISYNILKENSFSKNEFSIVPIRYSDCYNIMKWRNEQMYHLRQAEKLTKYNQENYFKNVIAKLFNEEKPNQILFSYLKNNECIGYGGLVHINWVDKNAEISFVLNTNLEKKEFSLHWVTFLGLIEKIAFRELELHKLFTYAFNLRPKLYKALELKEYKKEAILKEHCLFNQEYIDVIIHSKINHQFKIIEANSEHAKLLFDWVNEELVRSNSLSSEPIKWENHLKWFLGKIKSNQSRIFVFYIQSKPIGQVRLDLEGKKWLIDYSVDKSYRGKGLGTEMLRKILNLDSYKYFKAFVKKQNTASLSVFEKLGFNQKGIDDKEGLIEFYYNK